MPIVGTVVANPWPITFSHAWAMQPRSIESTYDACVQYCRKQFDTPFNDGVQMLVLPPEDPRSYLPCRKAQLAVSGTSLGIFMECNEGDDALDDDDVITERMRRAQLRYPLLYCTVDFVKTVSVFLPIGEVSVAGVPVVADHFDRAVLEAFVADIRSLFERGILISDLQIADAIERGIDAPGAEPDAIDFCC